MEYKQLLCKHPGNNGNYYSSNYWNNNNLESFALPRPVSALTPLSLPCPPLALAACGMGTKSWTHALFCKVPLIYGQCILRWHTDWICYSLRIFLETTTDWQSNRCGHECWTPEFNILFWHRVSPCHNAGHLGMNKFLHHCHNSLFSICKMETINTIVLVWMKKCGTPAKIQ